MQTKNSLIRSKLLELANKRGCQKTFCPSEVAQKIDPENWQSQMQAVRNEGRIMVAENLLICTQRGKPTDPLLAKGPIRFGLYSNEEKIPKI